MSIGTPALTSRNMNEDDMRSIVNMIEEAFCIAADVAKETSTYSDSLSCCTC